MRNKHIVFTTSVAVLVIAVIAGIWLGSNVSTPEPAPSSQSQVQTASASEPTPARENAVRVAHDPADIPGPLEKRPPETVKVHLVAKELDGQLTDNMTYTYWTFDDTVPGPFIRVREGDTVELTLTNDPSSTQPHSIDLHAVNGPGGGADVTQVMPGESKTFRFQALTPGVFVYHCATPYIPAHVANGMYGIIVVEPEEGFTPVDHEFYIMQGEIYTDLHTASRGHARFDDDAMWDENPNFVVFNGQYQAITGEHAMQASVGDRVRVFIGNGGPNLISSFHLIGEIFDVVHHEGAAEPSTNVQTTVIPAGGAAWVEFTLDVPGDYTFVDHALGRALGKGAIATLSVDGPENPDVFSAL